MRVVVAGGQETERRDVIGRLQAGGMTVAAGADIRTIAPLLMQGSTEVVLVLSEAGAGPPREVIRLARELLDSNPPYIFVRGGDETEAWWLEAFGAGADGELRSSASHEYLVERVRSAANRLHGKKKPTSESEKATLRSAVELVARTLPWRYANELIRIDTGRFLRAPATLAAEPPQATTPLQFGYTIPLSCPLHQLELHVKLGADATSGLGLAKLLLDEESDQAAEDTLSELANIMMGALKRGFADEGLAFTAGLPSVLAPASVLAPMPELALGQSCTLTLGDARVHVMLTAGSKAALTVTAGVLAEGMVLVRDVFNPKGLLLIAGGTRLSTNMIERLRGVLPPKQPIDVLVA